MSAIVHYRGAKTVRLRAVSLSEEVEGVEIDKSGLPTAMIVSFAMRAVTGENQRKKEDLGKNSYWRVRVGRLLPTLFRLVGR